MLFFFSDSKKGARKQRTTRAGDEENDQEETSSEEEEAEAHSDTEIQYSTPWYGTRVDDKTGFEVDLELKSNANKARPTGDTANFLLTSMSSVYGTEIHHPSKKDLLKYERCVELGLAYHQEAGEEETERNTSLSKEDESILQRRRKVRRFLLADADSSPQLRPFHYDTLRPLSMFTSDSSFGVEAPIVSESARQKYASCVRCALDGPKMPSISDCKMYSEYAQRYSLVVRGTRK